MPARKTFKSKLVAMKNNANGYPVGFVRIGGGLYQLDPSASEKEGVVGWIKVTQLRAGSAGARGGGAKRGGYAAKSSYRRKPKAARRRPSGGTRGGF